MITLIFLAVISVWAFLAFSAVKYFTRKIENKKKRWLLIMTLSPLLFFAPAADDIIGNYQFDQVCKEKKWVYDENKVRNSEVRYGGQIIERIDNKFIPIEKITTYWVDPVTEIPLVSQIKFRSGIGWLLRSIFKKPKYPTKSTVCYPDEYQNAFFKRLNITEVGDKE